MPLIRAILARAHLARGDIAGAADRALAALDAAGVLTYTFPFAVCLETAALVAAEIHGVGTAGAAGIHGAGAAGIHGAGAADLATLLATADALRLRGDRPSPPSLAVAVGRLRTALGTTGGAVEVRAAAGLARRLLRAHRDLRG